MRSMRALWTRIMLRGVHYGDRFQQLEMLYKIRDPWNLDCPAEHFRFQETNRIIGREFGRVGRLLEIGCGEGYQSQYLARVCDHLHGCDVSGRAVDRARERCPQGTFEVTTLNDLEFAGNDPFDLVVACEVLYYTRDVPDALRIMSRIGKACLVTFYQSQRDALEPIMTRLGRANRFTIEYLDDSWSVYCWRPD